MQIGKWDTMIGANGVVLGIARHIDMNAIILAFNTSPDTATGYLFSEDIISPNSIFLKLLQLQP